MMNAAEVIALAGELAGRLKRKEAAAELRRTVLDSDGDDRALRAAGLRYYERLEAAGLGVRERFHDPVGRILATSVRTNPLASPPPPMDRDAVMQSLVDARDLIFDVVARGVTPFVEDMGYPRGTLRVSWDTYQNLDRVLYDLGNVCQEIFEALWTDA